MKMTNEQIEENRAEFDRAFKDRYGYYRWELADVPVEFRADFLKYARQQAAIRRRKEHPELKPAKQPTKRAKAAKPTATSTSRVREWRQANPEKVKAANHDSYERRKARKAAISGIE